MKKNVGAGIIFLVNNEILLLKNHKGIWEIPGGKKEPREKLLNTARRETSEEIGYCPEFKKIGYFVSEKQNHKFKIYFGVVKSKFKCKLSHEHQDCAWFNVKKLPHNLHPKIVGAIEFLKKSLISLE